MRVHYYLNCKLSFNQISRSPIYSSCNVFDENSTLRAMPVNLKIWHLNSLSLRQTCSNVYMIFHNQNVIIIILIVIKMIIIFHFIVSHDIIIFNNRITLDWCVWRFRSLKLTNFFSIYWRDWNQQPSHTNMPRSYTLLHQTWLTNKVTY